MTKVPLPDIEQLVNDHWKFIAELLSTHGVDGDLRLIECHFKNGFIHGYKHGWRDRECTDCLNDHYEDLPDCDIL